MEKQLMRDIFAKKLVMIPPKIIFNPNHAIPNPKITSPVLQ